eukprot:6173306-Pleurochrysis_carterae.AAC.5
MAVEAWRRQTFLLVSYVVLALVAGGLPSGHASGGAARRGLQVTRGGAVGDGSGRPDSNGRKGKRQQPEGGLSQSAGSRTAKRAEQTGGNPGRLDDGRARARETRGVDDGASSQSRASGASTGTRGESQRGGKEAPQREAGGSSAQDSRDGSSMGRDGGEAGEPGAADGRGGRGGDWLENGMDRSRETAGFTGME